MSASWSTIGVVGCGLMGSGIAEVFARASYFDLKKSPRT